MPRLPAALRFFSNRASRANPAPPPGPPNTIAAAEAADEIITLETCGAVPARFAFDRPDQVRRPDMNPFPGWSTSPAAIKMYRFRDVVLDRDHMILLKQGRVIPETNYLQPQAAVAALTVDPQRLEHPGINGRAATCFDHWDANYYHWMAHTIPALHAMRQRHANRDLTLVLPSLQPWQSETLSLAGVAHWPSLCAEPGKQYFFPQLDYYEYVAGIADFVISPLSREAYETLAKISPGTASPRTKIYIDRSANAHRSIPNEPDLASALRGRGFQAIRPETMSVRDQIALFQQASMVVGQLGAGLANIAFCRPGTIVYEIVPSHHQNPCFLAMAMQGGLRYWGDVFETGVPTQNHTGSWIAPIDIGHVLDRVSELESLPDAG